MREKLIELIKQARRNAWGKSLSDIGSEEAFVADYLIANGVIVHEWIPVTERLPKRGVKVLCHIVFPKKMGFNNIITDNVLDGFGGVDRKPVWGWMGDYITHWMPLPAPPKEGA